MLSQTGRGHGGRQAEAVMTSVHLLGPREETLAAEQGGRGLGLWPRAYTTPHQTASFSQTHNPVTLQSQQLLPVLKAMHLLIRSCLATVHCVEIGT